MENKTKFLNALTVVFDALNDCYSELPDDSSQGAVRNKLDSVNGQLSALQNAVIFDLYQTKVGA